MHRSVIICRNITLPTCLNLANGTCQQKKKNQWKIEKILSTLQIKKLFNFICIQNVSFISGTNLYIFFIFSRVCSVPPYWKNNKGSSKMVWNPFWSSSYIYAPVFSWDDFKAFRKKHPKKLLRKTQIHFFSFAALTAKTSQAEEIMFQNVAYRPTVYRTWRLY